ncbi:CHAD domain-containing protein [Ralstonia mojiangensis]|uniref:CHAD domain-containing protein n=1 Tax=Ralstonia mojiangensis TaxID=2953895 RepID=UPI0021B283B1|nr:CHAD domain-containing protein [Ralstonia mojiangensis]MCT7325697.1 CHAD domain-containing protein [Ralstonia mojiangensis]MCT7325741.1 CHAD domain-containing protein [Ralstonia mojiangensis]
MSKHSHAAILSVFSGIVIEHIADLRDALAKLAAPSPSPSDEDLHQFRVTLRRLRSAWVTFAPVLPASFAAEWKPRLRALAASTGPVREWDVLLSDWLPAAQQSLLDGDEAGRAWLDRALIKSKEARNRAWEELRAELASPDVPETLLELERAVAAFHIAGESERHLRFARARAEALRKKLIRRGCHPRRLSAPRLHRARIAAKQWRYLYEGFYPALGAHAAKRYRKHLRKLQDALGEVHDASVSLKCVARLLDAPPPLSVVSAFHKRARAARGRAAKGLRWIRSHKAA